MRRLLIFIALIGVAMAQPTTPLNNIRVGGNNQFLSGATTTFNVGSNLTVSGVFGGAPTGGTLDLTNVTKIGFGAGLGSVTSVSVVTANGVSGSVANPTTDPAITLTLGDITPSSVNGITFTGLTSAALTVSGSSSVSGDNTGDQFLFSSIVVDGGTTVTPASVSQALTLVAGDGIQIATDNVAKTITLNSTASGTGTVTSVSVVTANGISGTVDDPTTTPAITLSLGAITPTSVNGVAISGSSTPNLAVTGTTAVSGTNTGDQTSVSGNAGTATALQTARTINGVAFDGTQNITVPAAAGTLTGSALASGVTSAPGLTSVAGGTFGTAAFVDATTADIGDSTNRRYITDAQLTLLGNTSGINTGDQNLFSSIVVSGQTTVTPTSPTQALTLVAGTNVTVTTDNAAKSITIAASGGGSGSPGGSNTQVQFNDVGAFGGDGGLAFDKTTDALVVGGSVTAALINGVEISGASTPTLAVTGTTVVSGTNTGDQTSVSGNAGTATALQTARNINGVAFDGTQNITVAAAAGTLTGSALASGVTSAPGLTSAAGGSFGSAAFTDAGDYVAANGAITGATATKVTFDAKGLVTAGTAATTADIADSADRRYVTDAELVVIGNTSGTNTGDQTSVSGNAGTATALQTARTINGVSFDGTANITIPAAIISSTGGSSDGATAPVLVYVKDVPVLTAGSPADVATITVPFDRYTLSGGSGPGGYSNVSILAETAVGTLAAATLTPFTGAGGTGDALLPTPLAYPTAAGVMARVSSVASTIVTSSTLHLRQNVDSANSGTVTFYILITPLP